MTKAQNATGRPVTMKSLIERINSALEEEGSFVTATGEGDYRLNKPDTEHPDFHPGEVWIVERVDPEALARKIEVLMPWEKVAPRRGRA